MATNAVYLPGGEISSTSGSPSPATSIKGEIFSGKASEKSIHLGDNKYSGLKLNSRQLLRAMKSTSAMILFATASAIVSAAPVPAPAPSAQVKPALLSWWCIPILDLVPSVLLGNLKEYKCLKTLERAIEAAIKKNSTNGSFKLKRAKRSLWDTISGTGKEAVSNWNWFSHHVTRAFYKVQTFFSLFT